jgi:hypothetical protein
MKPNHKPVRKCHGCGLNIFDHCGVYDVPREMWKHRTCPGYQNEEMLQQFQKALAQAQADPRRQKRQKAAKLRATEVHHQERLPLANR